MKSALAGSLSTQVYLCCLILSNAAAALLPYMKGWFCVVHRPALSSMTPGNRPMSGLGWTELCMLPHTLQLDTPRFSLTDARYLSSLARRRRALKDQLGCVRSLRASVRYFTAAGMSSKPRLLTANLVNLREDQQCHPQLSLSAPSWGQKQIPSSPAPNGTSSPCTP